ncbi:MAG: hypothetical protein IJK46_05925 [Prevotella sp.]|nr:hypothetical protein [Prevotella sp.]
MSNFKNEEMDEELEREIEKRKKLISDYLKIAPKIGIDEATIQKQTDLMLEDLSKLMKKRK